MKIERCYCTWYMHKVSGHIQSGEEWLDDQKHEGWPTSDYEYLVEVFWSSVSQEWQES
jgi:hypothetical protein